MKELVQS